MPPQILTLTDPSAEMLWTDAIGHPVVFLCMHLFSYLWLYFGYDLLRKGLTGDSRTAKEGVGMTCLPDLAGGLVAASVGAGMWMGSFTWI